MHIALAPDKTDAPLIIDPNAVRPCAIASEQLQLVTGRNAEVLEAPRLMQVQEFTARGPFDRLQSAHRAVLEKRSGVFAFERTDQTFQTMTCMVLCQT